ncbi:MAG: YicC/YloC family endoribonuclease [Sporolactobacillus sp.]
MTGFGAAKRIDDRLSVRAEIKSVNHRFFEVTFALPRGFTRLEIEMKRRIKACVHRGALSVSVAVSGGVALAPHLSVNWPLVDQYIAAMREMEARSGAPEWDVSRLALLPGVFSTEETDAALLEPFAPLLLETVEAACQQLMAMRRVEGEHLKHDLADKTVFVKRQLAHLLRLAPEVQHHHEQRLRARVRQFLGDTGGIDEERLMNELAIFADRAAIDEEVTRLQSHVDQFEGLIGQEKTFEPIGRRLDFLVQEMNREVNTIGAKGNELAVSRIVVELKSTLEKIREQVQNVE